MVGPCPWAFCKCFGQGYVSLHLSKNDNKTQGCCGWQWSNNNSGFYLERTFCILSPLNWVHTFKCIMCSQVQATKTCPFRNVCLSKFTYRNIDHKDVAFFNMFEFPCTMNHNALVLHHCFISFKYFAVLIKLTWERWDMLYYDTVIYTSTLQ